VYQIADLMSQSLRSSGTATTNVWTVACFSRTPRFNPTIKDVMEHPFDPRIVLMVIGGNHSMRAKKRLLAESGTMPEALVFHPCNVYLNLNPTEAQTMALMHQVCFHV